jgi:uncharacterized protein YbjT (DUF2867 family)
LCGFGALARIFRSFVAVKILVTGVTGFVGARLAPRLVRDGHEVVGFARREIAPVPGVTVVRGDAVSGAGLERALDGVEVAYYLIHSMEPSADGSFDARERASADNFARGAVAAGVRRIVYLGGFVPAAKTASPHLASRLAVEERLLAATPDSVAFRASVVIGARSRSFRFLVRLVERMPVLVVPGWKDHRTAPVDERDVIELLARAAVSERVGGQSLDIAGPDVVTYQELIERIRDEMLIGRPLIGIPRLTVTPIASRVSAVIASEAHELIGPLMEGLDTDLLPRDSRAAELLGVRRHSLTAAIERSLREWEATEPLKAR